MQRVSVREAKRLIDQEGYVYVDVRSVLEFERGHPAGAYNVPLANVGEFVSVMNAAFGKQAKLAIGCAAGVRSKQAAHALEAAGFEYVVEQRAGWDGARDPFGQVVEKGWRAEGLPSETGSAPGRSWEALRGTIER